MDGHRLLVVDDDRATCRLLQLIFRGLGLEVESAHTVADGVALLDRRPDFLILDISLPDGDGREVLERVRADGLPTRVAVTSGWGTLHGLDDLRPDAVLEKPVSVEALGRWLGVAS
jgi:CheY-like chemotaxis protein